MVRIFLFNFFFYVSPILLFSQVDWIKNSSPVYGERALGENVQMSDDGNTIISYSYDYVNNNLGKVQVFENINGEWIQKFMTNKNYHLVNWLHSDLFFVHANARI